MVAMLVGQMADPKVAPTAVNWDDLSVESTAATSVVSSAGWLGLTKADHLADPTELLWAALWAGWLAAQTDDSLVGR
jgi:hypothetical protein